MTDTKQQQAATSEMVQRVAKAVYDSQSSHHGLEYEALGSYWQNLYVEYARAAIAAMRDLPPSIVKVGIEADYKHTGYQTIVHIHQSMMDAALGRQTSPLAGKSDFAEVSDAANSERLSASNLEPTR